MPMGFVIEPPSQGRGVDEISIMGHADAVWAVDIERLSFSIGAAASSWVPQMTKAHEARQIRDSSSLLEDLGGETVALTLVEASSSTAGDNTGLDVQTS